MVGSRKRLRILCALMMLLCSVALASPAGAVEEGEEPEHEELPTIDDVGSQSETARQFFPEPYEPPGVFSYFIWPLLIVGTLIVLALLFLYLVWQPHFAQERRTKGRRR